MANRCTFRKARLRLEPFFRTLKPFGIAQAQVFVTDALRSGQKRIGKLGWIKIEITFDFLEPLHRVARSRLQTQDLKAALVFVFAKGGLKVTFGMQIVGQRNRAFKRKLGPRPDGKMRRRRRIAHQNDVFM